MPILYYKFYLGSFKFCPLSSEIDTLFKDFETFLQKLKGTIAGRQIFGSRNSVVQKPKG